MSNEANSNLNIHQFSSRRPLLTEIALSGWIGQASAGDVLEYYRGFIAIDILARGSSLCPQDRAALVLLARRAWIACEKQLIHLVQRRHGPEDYSYLAVARERPICSRASLSSLLLAEVA